MRYSNEWASKGYNEVLKGAAEVLNGDGKAFKGDGDGLKGKGKVSEVDSEALKGEYTI